VASQRRSGRAAPPLRQHARELRQRQTDCETLLWRELRGRRFAGIKFRRQFPIGGYVVDFFCVGARVAIELDGGQHAVGQSYEDRRGRALEDAGVRILRFWNSEVLQNLDGVLEVILAATRGTPPSPRPSPPAGGRGGS